MLAEAYLVIGWLTGLLTSAVIYLAWVIDSKQSAKRERKMAIKLAEELDKRRLVKIKCKN